MTTYVSACRLRSVKGQNRKSSTRAYVFRFAPESGHCATESACPFRAMNRHGLNHRVSAELRRPLQSVLINQASAGRLLQRCGQRPILLAAGPANRRDPTQMILRLVAVALLDLPQTVILPGLHMIRICFQGALVPDLRKLVVAELAIGIADQIGHIRVIVVAERLQLLYRRGIVIAVVDRRIGSAVPVREGGVVEKG